MTYKTLMVHLQLAKSNTAVLEMTRRLAANFQSHVIGIAADQPMQMIYGDGLAPADVYEIGRDEIAQEVGRAEQEFREALNPTDPELEWRSASIFRPLADYIAHEARSADLVLTGIDTSSFFDSARRVVTGDLIMQVGRPVLLVPARGEAIALDRVMIGWKDTREARRAVVDALPLLQQARHVSIVEVCPEARRADSKARLADVAAWLERHGVAAESLSAPSTADDASALFALGQDQGIDLTVAGAYGHSRLREWALGGVTTDLLVNANRCALVSH